MKKFSSSDESIIKLSVHVLGINHNNRVSGYHMQIHLTFSNYSKLIICFTMKMTIDHTHNNKLYKKNIMYITGRSVVALSLT